MLNLRDVFLLFSLIHFERKGCGLRCCVREIRELFLNSIKR